MSPQAYNDWYYKFIHVLAVQCMFNSLSNCEFGKKKNYSCSPGVETSAVTDNVYCCVQAQGWAGGGGQWGAGQVPGQYQQPGFPGQHGMQPGTLFFHSRAGVYVVSSTLLNYHFKELTPTAFLYCEKECVH